MHPRPARCGKKHFLITYIPRIERGKTLVDGITLRTAQKLREFGVAMQRFILNSVRGPALQGGTFEGRRCEGGVVRCEGVAPALKPSELDRGLGAQRAVRVQAPNAARSSSAGGNWFLLRFRIFHSPERWGSVSACGMRLVFCGGPNN